MNLNEILNEKKEIVTGTNCFNCKFTKDSETEPVEKSELNSQGGLKITDKGDLANAKKGDLVTLPGKGKLPAVKSFCKHKDMDQFVTDRMCCAYWDTPGIIRAFGKKVVGK